MNENFKILVVDDEEPILNIFEGYFATKNKYTILTARDGFEALELISREGIDCCFTDLSMPGMDGMELAEKIHAHDNTIPVVVITGYPSVNNAVGSLKNGVMDFLIKPFKMDEALIAAERAIRERSLFIENILLKEEAEKNRKLIKINRELQQKMKEVETINLILQQLNQQTTSRDLFNILVNLSGEVSACDEAHLYILGQEAKDSAIITSFFRDKDNKIADPEGIEENVIKKVADDGMPLVIRENNGSDAILAVPLKIRSSVFGVLISIIRNGKRNFSEKDLYLLNFLVEKAASLIENLALYENIYENLFSTLYAFVETIEARDPNTRQHSTRVTGYALSIAEAIGCSQEEIEVLTVSANLHDIGKIGVPDNILLKPGPLTEGEYEVIKKHPIIGANIIGHFHMWVYEQEIIKHHHERWDGSGYPYSLEGEKIPLLSRILSVADVYDALTSDRSYRKKLEEDDSLVVIREKAGIQFDPKLVDVFIELYKQGKISY